jgi:pyruvate,orthophosphate dikinase
LRIAIEMAEDEGFPLTRVEAVERVAHLLAEPPTVAMDTSTAAAPLTSALGASPGVAAGRIATSADMAVSMADAGVTVLLVRPETSPDDVHGMAKAAGILTSTGGLASHAAVVARGWGIPAVVCAEEVVVGEGTVTIGDHTFTTEDALTINGGTGEVFAGSLVGEAQIVPEAATLLGWAGELGLGIAAPGEGSTPDMTDEGTGVVVDGPAIDMVIRALLIKGFATPDGLAPAILCTEEAAALALDELAEQGLAEPMGAMYQLSVTGKAVGRELIATDGDEWEAENADAALDAFLPIDHRMKEIVTAWQMLEVDGKPVMNDHTDAEYDAAVLADFQALTSEADALMKSLCDGLPRLGAYRQRLSLASRLTAEGDHLYIASPRVDSYHTVWFELHEDLILLAGRTREDEVAEGRA